MEVPTGPTRIGRSVGQVIATVLILDDDLSVCLQIVGAQIQSGSRGEEDIPVLQDATEGDVFRVGKLRAVRPGPGVIFRQNDLSVAETEGLIIALRVDVRVGWR